MRCFVGPAVRTLIDLALEEDAVGLDATAGAFFSESSPRGARIVARQALKMAGGEVARAVFERVDSRVEWTARIEDGQSAQKGDVVARLTGPAASLLLGERVALNFLQRMCGVATFTAAHVEALGVSTTAVVDTRKTLPGWRQLDKYAVRCGGGANHRYNLAGGVMVKENHIAAAGGMGAAIERARSVAPHTLRVEVEVERIDQLEPALEHGAEVILLDNMDNATMVKAVAIIRAHPNGNRVVIEGSGNMDRSRLATLGQVGLDLVSVGALTHSAPAADLSMRFDEVGDLDEPA